MENKVIYVPVSVQEELPGNDEWVSFYINNENLWVGKRHNSRWMFFCSDGFRPVPESEPVTHWLKRIELPSEEDVRLELVKKYPKLDISYSSDRLLHHAR